MMCAKEWTFLLGALLGGTVSMMAQGAAPAVLQRGYDSNVTGATLTETTLTTANVAPNSFGLLYKLSLDSNAYAQPLYVPNVTLPALGQHNVLYVATMNDSIYAFDADVGGAPLWTVNLASELGTTAVVWANFNFPPVSNAGNLGILSTPVIDSSTNMMYVVACTLENGGMAYRLHAVSIIDGSEPYGPGVLITGSRAGATFDPRYLTQRTSLVLAANQVIVAFGGMQSEVDNPPATGWVMSYNKSTLAQTAAFNTVTANTVGGVWQSGRPPAVDAAGDVYVFVGNAKGTAGYDGSTSFSESVLKLDPTNALHVADSFTPSDWLYLDQHDLDLSGSGPMLIPGTTLLAGGGKDGTLYLLNTTNLGTTLTAPVQAQSISTRLASGPVYWNRSSANGGPLMYDWGFSDVLKAYPFTGGLFATSPSAMGTLTMSYPGPVLSLSANGSNHGSGLLWGTTQDPTTKLGILHAFDAENIATELWNSTMIPGRDGYGTFGNYVPPLIVNAKVYVSSFFPGVIDAYGLLPYTVQPASLAFGTWETNNSSPPQTVTITNISAVALPIGSVTISGANPSAFSQTNTCGNSVPAGSACTISVVFDSSASGSSAATLNVNGAQGTGTQLVALTGSTVSTGYTLSPTSLAFGGVSTNTSSAPQLATVKNASSAALSITSIALVGANRTMFSQTNTCGSSVPAGSACTINVIFAPTSGGAKTATVNVNTGGGAGTQSVALSGTGQKTPTYTLSPTALAFGSVAKNSVSAPLSLTVTNGGGAALPISSIAVAGTNRAEFVQTNTCGTSVPAGSACTISVTFAPTAGGAKSATVNVNAGGGAGMQTAALSGTGTIAATLTISPTALAFGSIAKNSLSAPQSVTVTNGGTAALPLSIALAGTNRGQFVQSNTCGSSVPGNSNCTVNVQFAPTSTGSKIATVNVTAGGSTQQATLGGTGI